MKLIMESWRGFLVEKELRGQKDKRVMYHIGRRPASPKPAERWGEKGGWTRSWMDGPVPSGVFMTPNPADVVQHHGVSGNVYAYKVPEWVINKAGGKQRYDSAGELLISQEIWDEAADEIEFLGKTMDQNDLWDSVEKSQSRVLSGRGRTGSKWRGKVNIQGLFSTSHPDQAIKMMTPAEREEAMAYFEDKYPVAMKGEEFEVEWEHEPGERKGWRKDFRLGEPRIGKQDQKIIDLLRKHMKESVVREYIREAIAPASNRGGDCYEAAGKYMMEKCQFEGCNLILVHGEVQGQGQLSGVRYGHAWVEEGATVIDKSNGRDLKMPKAIYYAIGAIASPDMSKWGTPESLNDPDLFTGGNLHKYSWEEARTKILDSENWGPWDLVTESGL